jgi:hypothetical protein
MHLYDVLYPLGGLRLYDVLHSLGGLRLYGVLYPLGGSRLLVGQYADRTRLSNERI